MEINNIEKESINSKPTMVLKSDLVDSSRWNFFLPRTNDIIISSYPKCGTTWVEHIALYLTHLTQQLPLIDETSHWLEYCFKRNRPGDAYPIEDAIKNAESQNHQRLFKTHLPPSYLPVYPQVKYLVVGRDARDCFMSYLNHQEARGWLKKDYDISITWQEWLFEPHKSSKYPILSRNGKHPFFDFYEHWFEYYTQQNILFVHYSDLKKNLPSEIRKIAEFLEIDINEHQLNWCAKSTSFDFMKENAEKLLPTMDYFEGGAKAFIFKGINGRWKEHFTSNDLSLYQEVISSQTSIACKEWLENASI
jgi:aryl sulfotransferase